MIADARRMSHESASLNRSFSWRARVWTGAFMVLRATAYLTRIRAMERARGFWERTFPLLVFLASIAGVGLLQSRPAGRLPSTLSSGAPSRATRPVPQYLVGLALTQLLLHPGRGAATVFSGPYGYVRHPLYLGEILSMLRTLPADRDGDRSAFLGGDQRIAAGAGAYRGKKARPGALRLQGLPEKDSVHFSGLRVTIAVA